MTSKATTPLTSAQIAKDVEIFVANGGVIEQIPMGKVSRRPVLISRNPPEVFDNDNI